MEIFTRAQWGARHDNGVTSAPTPADEVWLHHSVTGSPGPNATFEQDAATIRNLEAIGENRFGKGISYTWAITKAGRVFEGHSPNRQGTHTGGRNTIARAIVLVGNYETDEPTPEQLVAAAALLQYAKAKGWIKHARLNGGHRNAPGAATACPGDRAYAKISAINNLAGGAPVTPPKEDDDMADPQEIAKAIVDELFLRKTGQVAENGHQYNVLDTFVGNNKGEWEGVERLTALLEELTKGVKYQAQTVDYLGQVGQKLDILNQKLEDVLNPQQAASSEGEQK